MLFRSPSLMLAGVLCLSLACVAPTIAADGTLKIKFTLDGEAPKPVAVAGAGFCAKGMVDESKVIGPKKEIQNIVMWMWTSPTIKAPENPAAVAALAEEVKLKIVDCRYEPHIVLLHTSQKLVIENADPVGHTTKADLFINASLGELLPAGGTASRVFRKAESRPMPVACSIHPWINGYLLIRDSPYFGVSNEQGELTIPHIPEGKHTFVIWHEKRGFVLRGSQDGKKMEWKHGRMEVTIAGETALGEFQVPLD